MLKKAKLKFSALATDLKTPLFVTVRTVEQIRHLGFTPLMAIKRFMFVAAKVQRKDRFAMVPTKTYPNCLTGSGQ